MHVSFFSFFSWKVQQLADPTSQAQRCDVAPPWCHIQPISACSSTPGDTAAASDRGGWGVWGGGGSVFQATRPSHRTGNWLPQLLKLALIGQRRSKILKWFPVWIPSSTSEPRSTPPTCSVGVNSHRAPSSRRPPRSAVRKTLDWGGGWIQNVAG